MEIKISHIPPWIIPTVCIFLRASSFQHIFSIKFNSMSLSTFGSFSPPSLRYFVPYWSTQPLPASPAPNSFLSTFPTALRIQSPLRPIFRRSPNFLFVFLFFRVAVDTLVLSPLDHWKKEITLNQRRHSFRKKKENTWWQIWPLYFRMRGQRPYSRRGS